MPWRASPSAAATPAGPDPTTMTSCMASRSQGPGQVEAFDELVGGLHGTLCDRGYPSDPTGCLVHEVGLMIRQSLRQEHHHGELRGQEPESSGKAAGDLQGLQVRDAPQSGRVQPFLVLREGIEHAPGCLTKPLLEDLRDRLSEHGVVEPLRLEVLGVEGFGAQRAHRRQYSAPSTPLKVEGGWRKYGNMKSTAMIFD